MNKIIRENFEAEKTGYQFENQFKPIAITEVKKGEPIGFEGFGSRFEWIVTLKLGATFRANDVEKQQAQKIAEQMIIRNLYKDLLIKTAELKNAIQSGEQQEALRLTLELEKFYLD